MGIATDHAPASDGGMSAYTGWEIDVRMYDGSMNQIDAFTCKQDLWMGEGKFVVRLTRDDAGGLTNFEDRGDMDAHGAINGDSGFGGKLTGQAFPNNTAFLEGKGGSVDFIMLATRTGAEHYRCFRRFEAHKPVKLWGTDVRAGTYYITTEDQLHESADTPPDCVRRPLEAKVPELA